METTKTYLLIVNPISGDIDKADILSQVEAFAGSEGIQIVKYETTGEDDEKKISELYEKHHPPRILVAGGDGTIKMVAEAVEHHDVILGILPAGSANGLSVDLNFPTDFDDILRIAFHNDAMEVDMVCINGEKSMHLSDIGINANLVKNYEQSSVRGKIGYALQSLTTLQEQEEPFKATITVNGDTIETEAKMIVFANSQKYGTGVTINPIGKMDDGKFEIVVLKTFDLMLLGKIITGNMPMDSGEIEIFSAEKAHVKSSVPVHFQIDGEYFGEETEWDIFIMPKQLKVAIP